MANEKKSNEVDNKLLLEKKWNWYLIYEALESVQDAKFPIQTMLDVYATVTNTVFMDGESMEMALTRVQDMPDHVDMTEAEFREILEVTHLALKNS